MSGSKRVKGSIPTAESTSVLVAMLRRMLRPLVRMLVGHQIQYPLLARVLKSLYVEVASADFPIDGKRQTVSRLSLLTGIHRREVKRIQVEGAPEETAPPKAITLGAQIVTRWTGESPWVDSSGQPRALPRTAEDADAPSFHALVKSVSVDIHPRSVLDEWIRLGVASLDSDGAVVLSSGAFVPVHGFEEKAHFVARNLRDHLAAACSNLDMDAEDSLFLERSVFYASLPAEAIDELAALAREAGQEALVRVNRRARELKEVAAASSVASAVASASGRDASERGRDESPRESPPDEENRRITFGVYLYEAPAEAERMDGMADPEPGGRRDEE